MASLVRQPWRSGDIADRPDAFHVGPAIGIGLDMEARVGFDAQFLQTDILDIGHDTDRDDHMAEIMDGFLAVLSLDSCLHACVRSLEIGSAHVYNPVHNGTLF